MVAIRRQDRDLLVGGKPMEGASILQGRRGAMKNESLGVLGRWLWVMGCGDFTSSAHGKSPQCEQHGPLLLPSHWKALLKTGTWGILTLWFICSVTLTTGLSELAVDPWESHVW